MSEETFRSPPVKGKVIKFKREKKEDKIKKMLGDNFRGVIMTGDEIEILVNDDLSSSDKEKLQRIVDGE